MAAKWHPRQPITVIPNGVDPLDAAAPSEPGLRFASIARLAPEKRLGDLLRAFGQLRATHPAATLTVAGTGPLDGQLRQDAARLGIADAVSFPGYVQAPAVLSETDVLVQLSVWENCSYSLLDAVAHGRGVVASGVGGNPEILPPQCLADPDDPSAVAAAMAEQGLQPDRRPVLKPGWPTVATMTARIAEVYAPWR
ncbi:glycosyltransferase family 4 protein [Propioniciclava tarda]|nr:glycosyltransferase family 4 protein [Propioniciclava tarda]